MMKEELVEKKLNILRHMMSKGKETCVAFLVVNFTRGLRAEPAGSLMSLKNLHIFTKNIILCTDSASSHSIAFLVVNFTRDLRAAPAVSLMSSKRLRLFTRKYHSLHRFCLFVISTASTEVLNWKLQAHCHVTYISVSSDDIEFTLGRQCSVYCGFLKVEMMEVGLVGE